jgi:hypothetical protein
MKKLVHSLLLIGFSCWFLGGCVDSDIQGGEESDEALIHVEDVHQEQEAVSSSDEDLYGEEDVSAAELGEEGDDYETEGFCQGFSGSGSVCNVKCWNYQWYTVGCYYGCQPFVDYGQCGSQGGALCARIGQGPARGHCWN